MEEKWLQFWIVFFRSQEASNTLDHCILIKHLKSSTYLEPAYKGSQVIFQINTIVCSSGVPDHFAESELRGHPRLSTFSIIVSGLYELFVYRLVPLRNHFLGDDTTLDGKNCWVEELPVDFGRLPK